MLINPITLTVGERLEISRRRAGLTQKEAAALLGWPFKSYLRAEHGKDDEAAAPHIVSLAPGEECRVYRKREGLTLREVEDASGLKAKWIHRVEQGSTRASRPLENFWRQYKETNT